MTQVVGTGETLVFHNRLTHSLKVAQIGRRIAQKLAKAPARAHRAGGIDADVVEAAGLAHDIGHPPFGHIGEQELQSSLESVPGLDSFEGNAQSFRIVTKLATRTGSEDELGLNLSRATLRAILKYPWLRGDHSDKSLAKKWGAYRSETVEFDFASSKTSKNAPSVEAQIMDWADDVTYAVHDVEDFYRARALPLNELRSNEQDADDFIQYVSKRLEGRRRHNGKPYETRLAKKQFELLRGDFLPASPFSGSRADRGSLHELASALITKYVDAVTLDRRGNLIIAKESEHEVAVLKQLTWFYIIDDPSLATLQQGQKRIVRCLYDDLSELAEMAAGKSREERRLPTGLRELLYINRVDPEALRFSGGSDEILRARSVVDYITSLTEAQAVELYARLTGQSSGSVLDGWIRL